MNTLLSIVEKDYAYNLFDKGYNLGEVAVFGLQILGIGMITVFAVLSLIWVALLVFEKVFTSRPKTEKKAESATTVPVSEAVVIEENNDEEIVAVIAAAIAMAESENSGMKFRVVSFKRK